MSSVNNVTLIGNLGNKPELRQTQSGQPVASFSMATNEHWTSKTGEKQTNVQWHRVVVWGQLAKTCSEYLSKGRQVYVAGSLRTRSFKTVGGEERTVTEVHATKVTFLGNAASKVAAATESSVVEELPSNVDQELEQLLES